MIITGFKDQGNDGFRVTMIPKWSLLLVQGLLVVEKYVIECQVANIKVI
jgi:hypothetical protein